MGLDNSDKYLTTFCATYLLLFGSIFYFCMVAFSANKGFAVGERVLDVGKYEQDLGANR